VTTQLARAAARTPEEFEDRLATQRRVDAFDAFMEAIEESAGLEVPAPVDRIQSRDVRGLAPTLSAEAFELARRVYYLQHGTRADAARAIIAAGLSDTEDLVQVYERLKTWWWREKWPQRSTAATLAIRDAHHDGGLYRGRVCIALTTGNGPAPKGKQCSQSALPGSDYCFHHDPRPEYVEARRRQTERLTEGRRAGMVPLEPFQRWCDEKRKQLLVEEKTIRRVDPKQTGWGLLAEAMDVDQAIINRFMKGKHSRGYAVTTIKASTVARYVAPLGATFQDLYGWRAGWRPHIRNTSSSSLERSAGLHSPRLPTGAPSLHANL
jgi:hypothetical protein